MHRTGPRRLRQVASFLGMAVLSALAVLLVQHLLAPTQATAQSDQAQVARTTAQGLTVVRPDGLPGVSADVRPAGGGVVQILGVDGKTVRAQLGAGGTANCSPGDTGAYCLAGANAGLDVRHPDGNLAVRLGLLAPTLVPGVRLVDEQGNVRYQASLDADGNPTIQLFDAAGAVLWSAP
jgi:hypothetical protein